MIIAVSGKINNGKDEVGRGINKLFSGKRYVEGIGWLQEKKFNPNLFYYKKFADKLKDTICLWIGCTREQLEDRDFKETELSEEWWYYKRERGNLIAPEMLTKDEWEALKPNQKEYFELVKLTPRLLLQLVGTECGRKIIHPNIWINATLSNYNNSDKYIITDCRFPNEGEAVQNKKGLLIRVNRPIHLRFPSLWKKFTDQESAIAKYNEVEFLNWLQLSDNDMWKKLTHESETGLDNWQGFKYIIENDGTLEELFKKIQDILVWEEIL